VNQTALLRSTALAFAVSLALAGCGSNHKGAAPSVPSGNGSESQSNGNSSGKPTSAQPTDSSVARPDIHTPDSDYTTLHSNTHIMYYYQAYRATPPNYKVMATTISRQYRATSDVFKKHALMKDLKPIMDKKMAEAKAHPYVAWPMQNQTLADYSFQRHGFALTGTSLLTGDYEFFPEYSAPVSSTPITLRNSSQFGFLPVSSKALAKKIEYYVSHGNNCLVKVYMFVNGAELSRRMVKADGVKIELFSPNKKLLLTQYAQHFGN
jgi:hypothetical protein